MVDKDSAAQFGVEKLELDEIWPRADYITVHTPYMPQTHRESFSEIMLYSATFLAYHIFRFDQRQVFGFLQTHSEDRQHCSRWYR